MSVIDKKLIEQMPRTKYDEVVLTIVGVRDILSMKARYF